MSIPTAKQFFRSHPRPAPDDAANREREKVGGVFHPTNTSASAGAGKHGSSDSGAVGLLQILLYIVIAGVLAIGGLISYSAFIRDASTSVASDNLRLAVTTLQDIGQKIVTGTGEGAYSNYSAQLVKLKSGSDPVTADEIQELENGIIEQLKARVTGIKIESVEKNPQSGMAAALELTPSKETVYIETNGKTIGEGGSRILPGQLVRLIVQAESDLTFCAILVTGGPQAGAAYDSWSGSDRPNDVYENRQAHCAWDFKPLGSKQGKELKLLNRVPPKLTKQNLKDEKQNIDTLTLTKVTEDTSYNTGYTYKKEHFFNSLPAPDRSSISGE